MKSFFLSENVLTDNVMFVPDKGKVFKGGYIAIIEEYKFQNAWSDKKEIKRFRNKQRLVEYLDKIYPENDIDFEGTCVE